MRHWYGCGENIPDCALFADAGLQFIDADPPFLLYIPMLSAVVGLLVLSYYLLRSLMHYRPKWTRPFVKELFILHEDCVVPSKNCMYGLTTVLVAFSAAGLGFQIVECATLQKDPVNNFLLIPWVMFPSDLWGPH